MKEQTPQTATGPKHLVLVLDRSGSMTTVADDTNGGVASLLADQRKAQDDPNDPTGPVRVTLVQFDTTVETVYDRAPIESVEWQCHPRGMTALNDAIGRAVTRVLVAEFDRAEPGEHTVLVVVTDGHENASTEYTTRRVKRMIDLVRDNGWEVLFLGAGIDAWSVSDDLGIPRSHSSSYAKSAEGSRAAYNTASGMVVNSSAGNRSRGFTDADREAMTRSGQPETD